MGLRPPLRVLGVALAALGALAPPAAARTVARCDGARLAHGVARSVTDCTRVDLARGPEAAARQAIDRVAGALRVHADELRLVRASASAAGPRVRFQQYAGGVPVLDGQVAVALGPDGAVQHIVSGAAPDPRVDARPRLGRAAALLTARRRVPSGFDLVAPATTRLVAAPHAGGLELAWLVVLPVREPRGDWNVVVSARDGEVLDAYDTLKRVEGTTRTFYPNPIQTTGNTDLRGNTQPLPEMDSYVDVPLFDLDQGTPLLKGTFADLTAPGIAGCDEGDYTPGSASSATRSYSYTRNDPRGVFEETVAYAAIEGAMREVKRLGLAVPFTKPVPVNVHCFPDDDNSYYSPVDRGLHFGDGGIDDAEDGDVIVHELGHAIQDAQVPGFGPGGNTEQGAIGEGFGDVLAAFIHLPDGDAGYQSVRGFCVMEWDATSNNPVAPTSPGSGCTRWVDGTNESTGASIGQYRGTPNEVHDDGRYWSAMMTCIYEGIPPSADPPARDRILTLALAQTAHLPPTAENGAFADSVAALRAEDIARFRGEEVGLINDCGRTWLGFAYVRDFTAPEVVGRLTPAAPDGANGWYRTAPAVTWDVSDPESPQISKTGCVASTDPADTAEKTLRCTASSRGGVTAKALSYRKDAKPPSLAPALSLSAPRVGQNMTAVPKAADAVSGLVSSSCATPSTATRGPHAVRCTATDAAGNVAVQGVAYTVGARQTFSAAKPRAARNGNVSFRLRSNGGGRVRIAATAGGVRFRKLTTALTTGRSTRVTLRPAKADRRAFKRKLRGGRRVRVKVTITPELGGGKRRLTLKVRR